MYYAAELEGASILIFANGKIVVAGLRTLDSIKAGEAVIRTLASLA